jgi:hypothetical protein
VGNLDPNIQWSTSPGFATILEQLERFRDRISLAPIIAGMRVCSPMLSRAIQSFSKDWIIQLRA